MKKQLTKLLAFVLSVCMVVGMIPAIGVGVKADEESVSLGSAYKYEGKANQFTFPKVSVTGDSWTTMSVSVSGTGAKLDYSAEAADSADVNASDLNSQFALWTWTTPKTGTEVETILKAIVFTKATSGETKVSVSLSTGTTSLPAAGTSAKITEGTGDLTGHYYMYVPFTSGDNERSWHAAYNAAKGYTFMGMKGYLATITSTAEGTLLQNISKVGAWTGGTSLLQTDKTTKLSDPDQLTQGAVSLPNSYTNSLSRTTLRGMYYWACGPEHGTTINTTLWSDSQEPNAYSIPYNEILDKSYNNLINGTSNCYETCVQANRAGAQPGNSLNDMAEGNLVYSKVDTILGYFVEFGGYTDDNPDPGYGEGSASKPTTVSDTATVAANAEILEMQTFTFPEGSKISPETGKGIVSNEDNVLTIDPGEAGETGITVTVTPPKGKAFTEDSLKNLNLGDAIKAEAQPDGSVKLTFTKDAKSAGIDFSKGLTDVEAKVGDKVYPTLTEALEEANKAESGDKTVEMQKTPATAVTDTELKSGVTLKDLNGSTFTPKAAEGEDGNKVKVNVGTDGKVTVTEGTVDVVPGTGEEGAAVPAEFAVQGKDKAHDVSVGTNATVTVTKGEGGAGVTATVKPNASTDNVTIDGITYTGGTEYDLDDPYSAASKATVPSGKSLTVPHTAEDGGTDVTVNVTFTDGGDVTVEKNKPDTGKTTVTIPEYGKATVGGTSYEGPVTLEIDADGTITEKGNSVTNLTLVRDADGKITANGSTGRSERLKPIFSGATPNAAYYYAIVTGDTNPNTTVTKTWTRVIADENGFIQLNANGSQTLVYGDTVEISGATQNHDDAKKFRLLSNELLEGTFEGAYDWNPRTGIYGWRTTASYDKTSGNSNHAIETGSMGTYASGNRTGASMGGKVAELNAYQAASLYQEIDVSGEREFSWSLDYAGRYSAHVSGSQIMAMVIGPVKEDGVYIKTSSGTKDMFQEIVAGITDRPDSSNKQIGPFTVEYPKDSGKEYTVYVFWGEPSYANHFSGTVDVSNLTEAVFAFTAILPASGGSGNVLDNVKFQKPAKVYKVGQYYFETLESAIKAAEAETGDKTIEINDPSLMGSGKSQTGTLPSGVTLKDKDGNTYTGGTDGAKVSVDSNGKVTALGQVGKDGEGNPAAGRSTLTVKPAEGSTAGLSVQGKATAPHDVTVSGESTVTVTTDETGKVTGATVAPTTPSAPVEIDGVTYTGPSSGTVSYDVDDPFTEAPDGTKATIPESKAADSTFKGLTVPGAEGGSGFTVKPATGGGEVTVTKGADGKTSSLTGGTVKGTVEAAPEARTDGKVTVNGTTYTVPAAEDGETGSAKLGLVTVPGEGDTAGKDVVELLEGAVNVPQGKDVYVNGKQVQNSAGTGDITVTKDMPGKGQAQVDIPAGSKAKIGDTEFTGKTSVVVDADGSTSIVEGTAVLGPKTGDEAESVDVTVKGTGTDGSATSGKVTVTNPDETHSVTVKVPVSETNPHGQATVPKGGSVDIGGKTYSVPETGKDAVFEFDEKGDVSIASGAVDLADGNSVGFGSVTLGNDEAATEPASNVTVEVVTPADGEGKGKANVTVPKGETFTVTDKDGKEHTYKNNGSDDLTLTVDEDGKVTVKGSELPADGLELGPETPITVTDDAGETENNLVAGKAGEEPNTAGGATLKPRTNEKSGNEVPLLDKGSVCFPDEGGKVNVNKNNTEKRLEGKNVEVFAGENDTVKSTGNKGDGRDGEVTVEGGTKYYIPDGKTSEMNDSGVFGYPAKGKIEGNKDGPGDNEYVLVPNGDGLYTDNTDEAGETEGSGTESHVAADAGSGFDIKKKTDGASGSKDQLAEGSLGHYEGAVGTDGAKLTVEHKDGSVTLTDGSVTMTKGTETGSQNPSVYVDGVKAGDDGTKKGKVTGDGITVTTTHDDKTGKANGADVTVPQGKSVEIDGQKYDATEGDLELHISDQGKVTVKKGTVKLDGTDDTLPFGDTSIKGSGDGSPKVTVTIPASDGSENAKVEVAKDGEVTIGGDGSTGGKTYKNAGEGELELEVTPEGDVELKKGSVTLPDNNTAENTASVDVPVGDKNYNVSGDGVTVTADGTKNPTAKTTEGGSVTVDEGNGKSTTYTAPTGKSAEVELTPDGPELKSGAVELDPAADGKGESIEVNGVTVQNTSEGTGTDHKVTVEKDGDSATVKVPAGGKANVNGVEVTGKADVTIDEDGVAHIKPDTNGVELNGKTYKKKDGADADSEIVIDKNGKITPTPASAFIVEIDVPTEGPVHVGPGETLTFNKGGKEYSVTGGETGGYFTADGDGNITVTDVNGAPKAGPYKDAGTSGLKFTVNDDVAALDDGTVKLADGETVGFGDVVLGNNRDGKTTEVTVVVPGGENEPEKSKAKVTVPNGETFTVTDKDGKTHTYKNNGTGNLELWVDKDGNVTVKDLPTGGLTLGAGSTVTVADDEKGTNGNTMTAGDNGATLKKNDTTKKSNPPKLTDGSVILPSDEDATVYVDDTSVASGNKEKELKGRNVEVFASVPADEDGTGGSNVKIKGADKNGGEGEVTVQGGTRYSIGAGVEAAMNNASFSSPAKGVVANSKDGLDDDSNPANNHFVLVPDQSSNKEGLYSAESEGTNSHVFAENGAAFDIRPKKENLKGDLGKAESNLDPSIGHYEGVDKGATLTVDHSEANGGEVTLNNGSVTMTKGEGAPPTRPSPWRASPARTART